jgi:hypothetical protein
MPRLPRAHQDDGDEQGTTEMMKHDDGAGHGSSL